MILITIAIVMASLVSSCLAWSPGDVVPVNVFLRINKTIPTSSTPIPYDFCPRFAWNKLVEVPSIDYGSDEKDVAIKFEIGRGVNRQTKWMALKELPSPTNGIKAQRHLTMIVFKFGFQLGAFGKFTSFHAYATYSDKPHEVITIKYEWDEHRTYNPHTALSVVSGIALVLLVLLMHRLSFDALAKVKSMSRLTVIHARSE